MNTRSINDFLNNYVPEKQDRFGFEIPETVADDLLTCYKKSVLMHNPYQNVTYIADKALENNILEVAKWLRDGRAGLVLYGKVGTGKTMIMKALKLLISFYADGQNELHMYKATELNEMVLSKDTKEIDRFNGLAKLKYLAIDELGGFESSTVNNFGTQKMPVADLLHAREAANKVTILTTNLDISGLESHLGTRILDRLMGSFNFIPFEYQSFRNRKP